MRYAFLRALALAAGVVPLLVPAARAQDKPGPPPTIFSYHDTQTTGRLHLFDRGADAATGGRSINVLLWRGNTLYTGSGFMYQIDPEMPFSTLMAFTVQNTNGVTLCYQGTMISGITVSANGTFHRPRSPESKLEWGIVIGGPAAAESSIQGTVVEGPIHPVERPGVVNERPLAGAVILFQNGSGKQVARAKSDAQGRFTLILPPGSYRVVPQPPKPGSLPSQAEPFDLTIGPGEFRELKIKYRTFIR
jgi:hypothetical protein